MIKTEFRFAVFLLALAVLEAALLLGPGVLRVTGHEGDMLHAFELAYRVSLGEVPHVDFMTPLGYLSVAPIAGFLNLGFAPGRAFMLAQIMVMIVLLAPLWWVCASRLEGGIRYLFGAAVVLIVSAMIYGGPLPSLAISMYYNRWAWAVAFLIVLVVFLPARPGWQRPALDGLLIGSGLAALILLKATYVVALVPFLFVALLIDKVWKAAAYAVFGLILCMAIATLALGDMGFWWAYVSDLLFVAGSEIRPRADGTIDQLLSSPGKLPGNFCLLLSIVLFRKSGLLREGLLLLVLAPGLIYITFQNWGNDPKWLLLLAVIVLSLAPRMGSKSVFGKEPGLIAGGLALSMLVLFSPSAINIAYSNLRHLFLDGEDYVPVFREASRSDLEVLLRSNYVATNEIMLNDIPKPKEWDENKGLADFGSVVTSWAGEVLPECQLNTGFVGRAQQTVASLIAIEETLGKNIMVADSIDNLWMFGPFPRIEGMASWFYGDESGFDKADYVVLPFCAVSTVSRRLKMETIEEKGWTLSEVARNQQFILLRRDR